MKICNWVISIVISKQLYLSGTNGEAFFMFLWRFASRNNLKKNSVVMLEMCSKV